MAYVFGTNKLPEKFSPDRDVERLAECACGSTNLETVCLEWGLGIEKCSDCGLVRTNPRLTQAAIQRLYEENARSAGQSRSMAADEAAEHRASYRWRGVEFRYRPLARQLRNLFPAEPKPSLLEVGFGGGEFITELRNAGFAVRGFDVAPSAVERLESGGIPGTYAPSLQEARFPDGSFDMVVMWEVFEHIPDPSEFAREVRRILKPGGFWFLQVPNWRWLQLKMRVMARVPGKKSYLSSYGVIGPLFHLFHYTHESLRATLERARLKYRKSFHIRLYGETRWQALVAHEIMFNLEAIPSALSGNRRHWNVILAELYQRADS